jgi:ATP-dependent DNA ligase
MPEQTSHRWKGIMKCVPFEEHRLAKWNPPYIVQPKLDGDRCRNEPLENGSFLLSSEENIFYSVPHINQQLLQSGLFNLPLDGELYSHELFQEGGHELIHSIASRTVNIHPRHKELEYWIFDIKRIGESQITRTCFLNSLPKTPLSIKIAPYWLCQNLGEVKTIYDNVIKAGFEGIVIRHLHNIYEEKRSTYLMKFKPKRQDTYHIIGWNEEVSIAGIPKGRIGSLIMSSQQGDSFAVSAGLDDNDRDRLWNIRDTLAGKDAIVHFQHLTNKKIPKGCFDVEVLL